MSLLIADSGSTKTEWIFINAKEEKKYYHTDGLNPYFSSFEKIKTTIGNGLAEIYTNQKVDSIYFYGAGCSSSKNQKTVKDALSYYFNSSRIEVETDLLASAKACFRDNPGVACILGTGSNSCIYDGAKITDRIPSLGFTLGDEGSGGYFGKKILRSYFYRIMPKDLSEALEEKYEMDLEFILEKLYKEPNGNRFVASFAQILGDYSDHEFIKKIVREGFEDFTDKQLRYFGDISDKNLGFVGSIAYVHQSILKEVLEKRNLKLSIIVQKPIERLLEYHVEVENQLK